jgi:hypothetical protein
MDVGVDEAGEDGEGGEVVVGWAVGGGDGGDAAVVDGDLLVVEGGAAFAVDEDAGVEGEVGRAGGYLGETGGGGEEEGEKTKGEAHGGDLGERWMWVGAVYQRGKGTKF